MRRERPLIGVTTRHEIETERFYLARAYCEAVEAAGGVPLMIPLIPREGYVRALVEAVDGLLLPGSASDVDPLRYGREPHRGLGVVHPLKDETDALAIRFAEARGLPVLAICYGMQALNVSRGGTLIQDIGSEVPGAYKHEQGAPRGRRSHTVSLLAETHLARLAGVEKLHVNSHHHQAVETLGAHLRATAWAQDGLIEAFEDTREGRWVQAVQWHPEIDWQEDDFSKSLFESFIDAARAFGHSADSRAATQEEYAPCVR